MQSTGTLPMAGNVRIEVIRKNAWVPENLWHHVSRWTPKSDLGKLIRETFRYLPEQMAMDLLDRIRSVVIMESALGIQVRRHNGQAEDYGIVSRKLVTTAGCTAMAVAWANATFDAKYMGLGTGAGAEAASNTGLSTEIAANHYAGGVRPTCTHVESTVTVPLVGAHTQTTDVDGITEHGIFTSATQGAVTLWDKSLFSVINLAVADVLTATYTLTLTAGG